MRIFSKQAFRFNHPSGSPDEAPVYVRDQQFNDVPEWVAESATFKLAHKHELITVIENKKDELAAEVGKSTKKSKEEK